jgi:hypothetical protein
MNFQFKCPRGHLLEGEPSQAGQQCNCPTCGTLFIIPAPLAPPPEQAAQPGPVYQPDPAYQPGPAAQPGSATAFPQVGGGSEAAPAAPFTPAPVFPAAAQTSYPDATPAPFAPPGDAPAQPSTGNEQQAAGPQQTVGPRQAATPAVGGEAQGQADLLHIPCPNGHELETPREMLGQEVLCPYCEAQFRLREKDSVESKRRRVEDQKRQERQLGKAWFNWAIVAVVIVIIGLAFLIFSSSG